MSSRERQRLLVALSTVQQTRHVYFHWWCHFHVLLFLLDLEIPGITRGVVTYALFPLSLVHI